jgi:hypothetical protein
MGRRLRVKGYAQRDEDDCGIQMAGNSNSRINNGLKYVHTRTRKSTVLKEHLINKGISQSNEIFPLWFPWILFPLILCIRLSYILKPTNWWILHPDEIFQTMEGIVLIYFCCIIYLFIFIYLFIYFFNYLFICLNLNELHIYIIIM